ncbi:MAG: FmdB family zinc ribbon protein, partial [Woeseiaceae bacterium]
MPFYEYQCSACGHHHEELQKVTGRVLRKCPSCGRNRLKRLVSAPVFRLKGSGWYETDFKADKEEKRNLAGEKEPPAEKPKEEKADAKPADKAADKKSEDAKAAPADAQPKTVGDKSPSARKTTARRRT